MSWQCVPLEELAVKRGGSVNPAKYEDETFELFSIPAYDRGEADICPGSDIGSSKKCVEPKDVLLSRIVPHIRRSWVVSEPKGYRQIASGEWIQFRGSNLYPAYLRHYLVSDPFHSRFMRTVSGVGGSLLRARPAEVYKIPVPLPPLEEQKRIARILDAADALRAKRRESLAQLDALLQSTFLDMFGDPVANPMGWDVVTLGDKAEKITKGQSPKWQGFSYQDEGALFVTSENVREGYLDITDPKFVHLDFNEKLKGSELREGDLLINLVGASIGRSCVFHGFTGPANINQAVGIIRLNDSLLTNYVAQLLRTDTGMSFLTGRIVEAARANISLKNLRELALPVPRIDLQKDFATIVQSIEHQKAQQRSHLAELDTLFAALQARAFAGEL